MSMPKYSFIVPVYNCEKYLEECIDSILEQTFKDFEILLINDGSTDSSGIICDKIASKDFRVKVFHEDNGGAARARNLGVLESKGEYIWFVDSDDRLSDCFALTDADKIITGYSQLDILFFLFNQYDDSWHIIKEAKGISIEGYLKLSGEQLMIDLFNSGEMLTAVTSPVNKIFNKKLIIEHSIAFPQECKCHEEDEFLTKAIFWGNSFYFFNEVKYDVRTRTNSLSTQINDKKIIDRFLYRITIALNSCRYFEEKSSRKDFLTMIYKYYSYYFLSGFDSLKALEDKSKYKEIISIMKHNKEMFKFFKFSKSKYLMVMYLAYRLFGCKFLLKTKGALK